jgi:hypothetical protein
VLALVSAAALVLFASRAVQPWNATVQRAAVTLPLAAEVLIAARLLAAGRRARTGAGPHQVTDLGGAGLRCAR